MIDKWGKTRLGALIDGAYRLFSVVRSTPSAHVYVGRSTRDGSLVAVKILDISPTRQARARFAEQIAIASSLSHPGICPIVASGELKDGALFAVMPWIAGSTVTEALARGPFTPDRAIDIIGQVLSALAYAHAAGVVHRDIKPSNVMLIRDAGVERSVLLDFGIARRLHEGGPGVTATGAILGTPCYMAPEQLDAKRVDHRADLFSVGVVLYQMLSGELPDTLTATLLSRTPSAGSSVRPLRGRAPHVPEGLEAVVLRALSHDPLKRFDSAEVMLTSLRESMQGASRRACSDKTTATLTIGESEPAPWARRRGRGE